MRRRGFTNETIAQVEDIYRTLYLRGLNVSNALAVIEKDHPASKEIDLILDFIRSSQDGVIRGIS